MLTTHHLPHLHHHRGSTAVELDKVTNLNTLIVEINSQVVLFRDMLIHVGQARDCPELREKIRKLRRTCVEACKHTGQIIMPQVKSAVSEGVLTDNPHLVLLFYLAQRFLHELIKSYRLIQVVPMDMSGYYENRAGPSNLGNVISQILLCKQITPDFNQEELCSITKDSQEIAVLLAEMQEYMPQHDTYLERSAALDTVKSSHNFICKNMSLLCCMSRPKYL
ncbi:uncharacterized protein LOC101453618 [Ceratitis capitata]|uniref:uncharacterized protein LOC101453618 n=1 Tax=Ceratitis capitata TaxID=7213 RepID=UPI0006188B91|nr:uncharacterized protein LOC101453618 [Ceratitis capitata]